MQHTITLNDYQIANLRALIQAIGYPWDAVPIRSPLCVANTGDWLGELYQALPEVEHTPNMTGEAMAVAARIWE